MSYFIRRLFELQRLDALIRRKATGCPDTLARKFDCSRRSAINIISELKGLGAQIRFDSTANSYVYENGTSFRFDIGLVEGDLDALRGGYKSVWNFGGWGKATTVPQGRVVSANP